MRISDWSSDVCSSDLADCHCAVLGAHSGGGAKCYRVLDKPMTKMSDLRDELAGEVETILSDAFTICTPNTAVAPHSDDVAITFPNIDVKTQSCKLIDTSVIYLYIHSSNKQNGRDKARTQN